MLKHKKTVISMATALCAFALVGGATAINANADNALNGFTCAGASVNAQEVGVRFEFNLEGEAAAKQAATAGVVYMPYDLYTGALEDFTLETQDVATAQFGWEAVAENEYVGYSYLQASAIPVNMYNRILLVRGYIQEGENVYYTETVKTSMAYSAYYALENYYDSYADYEETLNNYMGPYTLTSEAGNVEGLLYGEEFYNQLPATYNGKNIVKWFWNAEKTVEIAETDYATGSMPVYFDVEKFAVSGTVNGTDLANVKVYANGTEVGAVAANGEYTIWLEAGNYELRFANDAFVAFANVEVAAAVSQDVTLVSNKWEAGKVGAIVTHATFNKADALDGVFTPTTEADTQVVFPNAASTNAFEYTVKVDDQSGFHRDQSAPAAVLLTDRASISVGMYQWGKTAYVNVADGITIGDAFNTTFTVSSFADQNKDYTVTFVRVDTQIECYINNTLCFTFTKDNIVLANGVTQKWANSLYANWGRTASFFEEDAKIYAGVCNALALNNNGLPKVEYTLSMQEFAKLNGKVSLPEGATLDVTNTTLTVNGVPYAMTIGADGNFTALVPAGTQTFEFKNGTWGATVEDVVVSLSGTNTVNATLADYTWAIGNFGAVNASADGYTVGATPNVVTMSGAYKGVLFPYTATQGNFTYEVQISNVSGWPGSACDQGTGVVISDGQHFVGFSFYRWDVMVVNMGTSFGSNAITYFVVGGTNTNFKVKIVKTSTSIEVYLNNALKFTLNSDGTMTHSLSKPSWAGDTFTNYWASYGKRFFEADSRCAGLFNGLNGTVTATYTCSFTNN